MNFLFYICIALVPLPFASARPVWQSFWTVYIGVLALAYWYRACKRPTPAVNPMLWHLVAVGCGLSLWGWIQSYPLPFIERPISIDPISTQSVSLFIFAYTVWLLIIVLSLSPTTSRPSKRRGRQLIFWIATTGTAVAAYGLVEYFSGNTHVLWFEKYAYTKSLTATFINRNSFAAYCGLTLQCMVAYIWYRFNTQTLEENGSSITEALLSAMWHFLAVVILLTALILTGSRAGIITSIAATGILITWASFHKRSLTRSPAKGLRWLPILGFTILAVGVAQLSGELISARLQNNAFTDQRIYAFQSIVAAIAERPWGGFGLGSFSEAFRLFRSPDVKDYFDRGHSDPLELAMTAGIPAMSVVLMVALTIIARLATAVAVHRRHGIFIILGVTSSIQIFSHAAIDFPFQMPAITFIYLAIIGCSLAFMGTNSKVTLDATSFSFQRLPKTMFIVSASAILIFLGGIRFLHEFLLVPGTPIYEKIEKNYEVTEADLEALQESRLAALRVLEHPKTYHQLGSLQVHSARRAESLEKKRALILSGLSNMQHGLELAPFNTFRWLKVSSANLMLGEEYNEEALRAWRRSIELARYEPNLLMPRIHIGILVYRLMNDDDIRSLKEQLSLASKFHKPQLESYVKKHGLAEWIAFLNEPGLSP